MTRTQAIKIYIKSQVHAEEQIRRLMLWNEKLSIPENVRKLGVDPSAIRTFINNSGVKFKVVPSGSNHNGVKRERGLK